MKPRTNHFLIGLFVLLGIVLAVVTVVLLGAGSWAQDGLIVETYFQESVQGLDRGAHVRFRGVKIGEVTEINVTSSVYETEKPYVLVRSKLFPTRTAATLDDLRELIRRRVAQGFRVRLASQGLTGALYLETDLISDPSKVPPPFEVDWTPETTYVPSAPSTITQFSSAVERILMQIEKTDLAGLVDDARTTLGVLTDSVRAADAEALVRSAREVLAELRTAIAGVRDVVHRSDALLADGHDLVRSVRDQLGDGRLARVLDDAARVAASLDAMVGDARGELRDKGRDVELVLEGLRQITTHLGGLAATLERYPSLMLLGTPPPRREERK